MKIRVATYNIHKGVTSIGSTPRVLALKKAIEQFDADVVFLQEVQGRHDHFHSKFGEESRGHRHWPERAQHEFFAGDSRNAHAAYGMNAVYDHGHHGNALLSCFPIDKSHNHDVSDHAYEQRGILHCVLNTEHGPVHCYVVHLGQSSRIGDLVRNLSGREKIVRPARTFPAALPWFRLDRIYVRGFKVDTAQVLHGTLWAKLSDHAPIVANLKLS